MYIFANIFFGHRISRKLADIIRHVQQQVLQSTDLETYGPAAHGEIGRRFVSTCHSLQTERQFVALVGFMHAEMLAECRQMDRHGVQKRRSQNYRRLSGGAELEAGMVIAAGVKSYSHVLGVIWVGVGSVKPCGGGQDI
jgi:hypothetical protein